MDSYWTPDLDSMGSAERNLRQISELDAKIDPTKYFRQYVGVQIVDKRLLYLNVVDDEFARLDLGMGFDPLEPISVCDGGYSSWGALYDPEDSKFFSLEITEVGG